jgi:uncharacterized protein involved in outer membrane biogenesis
MKILRTLLIIAVLLVVVGLVARDAIIKTAVRKVVQQATGFDLELGGIHAGLLSPSFEIRGLKLINPEDFPEATALEINRMFASYEIRSFFEDEIHLREVVLDIPRIVVVQKEDGESNLQRLSEAGRGKEEGERKPEAKQGEKQPTEPKVEKPARKFRIDRLTLKLGMVETHKYFQGRDKPEIQVQDLKVDRTYTDIRDLNQLATFLAMAMVESAGVQMFKDIGKVFQNNQGNFDKTGHDLGKAAKDVQKSLKSIFKSGK